MQPTHAKHIRTTTPASGLWGGFSAAGVAVGALIGAHANADEAAGDQPRRATSTNIATMPPPTLLALLAQMGPLRLRALFAQAPHRAAEWVRAIAAQGMPQAQVCYGRLLLEGTGVAENKVAALRWFERAATHGDLEARNMVGRCHDNGWGTRVDPAAAAFHYASAAAAGHDWAQYNLGNLYLEGRGVARDFSLAFAWYRRAADQRHARAMSLVGRCCEEGWGTPCDLTTAAQWYRRSAESGYFRGQYNWATVLLSWGRGDEAAIWLERAAQGGTFGVRRAIVDLLERAGATRALFRLKVHLTRSSPLLEAARPDEFTGDLIAADGGG